MKRLSPLFSAILLGLPGVALADTVVLAPLYGKAAGDLQVVNVTALIASELDFRPEFDDVIEISKAPASSTCIKTPTCLATLAKEGGGTKLVTGNLTTTASTFTLDMVYFDARTSSIVRSETFTLSSEPEAVADGMTGVVKSLLTGAPAAAPAATKTAAAEEFHFTPAVADEDSFEFDDGGSSAPAASSAAARKAEEERKAAEAERLRRAEEEKKAEAERVRREEEERLRREEEERRRKEEAEVARRAEEERVRSDAERKRVEEAAAAAEAERRRKEEERKASAVADFDPSMITFGGSAADIKVESAATARPTSRPAPAPAPRPEPARSSSDDDAFDFDDLDADADSAPVEKSRPSASEDLDDERLVPVPRTPAPSSRPAPRPPPKPTTRKPTPKKDTGHSVQLTARGGYAPFQTATGTIDENGNPVGGGLAFVTYGGEVAVPIAGTGLHVIAGVEGWSVNRLLPPDLAAQAGQATWWNTIFPINAGLVYKVDNGSIAVPYAGVDLITALYFTDPNTSRGFWALGPRARLGVDLMFTRRFGLTVGGNVGVWSGSQWYRIEPGMRRTALLPQIQGGTVFSF